jgi:hypothetical protein
VGWMELEDSEATLAEARWGWRRGPGSAARVATPGHARSGGGSTPRGRRGAAL